MTSKIHIKKLFAVIATLLTLTVLPISPSHAFSPGAKPRTPKASCRIEIDNAHISRHAKKFGERRAVLVKARSICTVIQQQVTLTVNIYKVEKFGNPLLGAVSTDPLDPASSGKVVRNYDNLIDCKNFKRTKYYGVAYAKALINGRWNYAGRVRSPKTIEINCGT